MTGTPFISEFLASNSTGLLDEDGDASDWVEITNPSGSSTDLTGWHLTDNSSNLTKWQFPSVTIPAGSSLIVFASSKNRTNPLGELHTNYQLEASGEFLALVQPDGTTIVSEYAPTFPPQVSDMSYGYEPVATNLLIQGAAANVLIPTDDSLGLSWTTTLFNDSAWEAVTTGVGFSTDSSYNSFIGSNIQSAMLNNGTSAYVRVPFIINDLALVDALQMEMRHDDGFVAYLNGTEVARRNAPLSATWNSVATTDQPAGLPIFEQLDLSAHLGLLVQGKNLLAVHGLNSSASNSDFLVAPTLISWDLNAEPPNFLQVPTPGLINLPSAVNQVAQVEFSHERGFYQSTFNLSLSSDTPGAQIRYTLNGSAPTTTSGLLYSGPISIPTTSVVRAISYNTGMQSAFVKTHTYLFLTSVIQQPTNIAGYPNPISSVGPGGSVVHDYQMDPAIVRDPTYAQSLIDGLLNIPTMAISVDVNDMFGTDGFYLGESEKPMSVEIINFANPGENVQANGRIEAHSHNRLKRSLRLSFSSDYGPTKLVTSLFQGMPVSGDSASNRLDNIVLRAGNNRAWSRNWNPSRTTYTEDQWYRDSQIAMSGYGAHGAFVHLYINGIYWGLYNPNERPDEGFSEEYFGGGDEHWYSRNHDGRTSGDPSRWNYLTGPLIAKNMSVAANYAELQQFLDVENFADYMILNWYQATTDWPQNNWYASNRNDVPSPTRFYSWDGEWSWDVSNGGTVDGAWVHPNFRAGASSNAPAAAIWRSVKNNSDFMTMFADRAYAHLFHDGALTDANSLARWQALNDHIRDAIVAESARWGDALKSLGQPTRTRDVDWQNEVNALNALTVGNGNKLITAMRAEGYYPSLNAPELSQHGGVVPDGFNLAIVVPPGATGVYYTLDGSDPRLPGGALSPSAMLYNPANGIVLNSSVLIRARAIKGSEWSAVNQTLFSLAPIPGDFDLSGVVDQADYDLWKRTFGSTTLLAADGNQDGIVDAADYVIWRNSLGATPVGYSFNSLGQTYTQDFNLFRGTEQTLPAHFSLAAVAGTDVHRGVFNSTTSGASSFTGIMGATTDGLDHSLAWRERTGGANLEDARVVFAFTNNTGAPIAGFDYSFDVEAWVNGRRDNQVRFKYDVYANSVAAQAAEGRNAFETDIAAIINPNHTPIAANGDQFVLDGKSPANRVTVSGTVDFAALLKDETNPQYGMFGVLLPGQTAYFRWQISNANLNDGNRSALAIDNLSLTPLGSIVGQSLAIAPSAAVAERHDSVTNNANAEVFVAASLPLANTSSLPTVPSFADRLLRTDAAIASFQNEQANLGTSSPRRQLNRFARLAFAVQNTLLLTTIDGRATSATTSAADHQSEALSRDRTDQESIVGDDLAFAFASSTENEEHLEAFDMALALL